jgi:hypothetical protein
MSQLVYVLTNGYTESKVREYNYACLFHSLEEAKQYAKIMGIHLKYDFYAIEMPKHATKANIIVEQSVRYEMTIKYVADYDAFKHIVQEYYPNKNPHKLTYDWTADGLFISQNFGDRALNQHNYIYIGDIPFMD